MYIETFKNLLTLAEGKGLSLGVADFKKFAQEEMQGA